MRRASTAAATAPPEAAAPILNTVADAQAAVARMKECLGAVAAACEDHTPDVNEATFVSQTQPSMDEATALSRQMANFLDKAKHHHHAPQHDKAALRALQMEFVATMKRLQETQRMHARKHEAAVEFDLLQGGTVTSDEFKAGKDVLEKELALAEEMGHLVQTVGAVKKAVHDQTATIEQVKSDLDAVSITIGKTITTQEQAAYLRKEKMKKLMLIWCLVVVILAIIVVPIVLACTKH
ncbi:Aste57867_14385 [Aphanomyces stellatus]|uniref:Aste57867_14385 protein n=1 Tax=Aphanomyces stellatus TaxID=120398 RepID=A0A485L1C6_9STRA|nr:hypothetical protein As57867_014331 [Aphanomyces stellatus]VFT91208.1 Aste57867_14385 [Aphanomyces stellatus]